MDKLIMSDKLETFEYGKLLFSHVWKYPCNLQQIWPILMHAYTYLKSTQPHSIVTANTIIAIW